MGACVARIQDGVFYSPAILPTDWFQDVGGDVWIPREASSNCRHWVDNLITPTLLAQHFSLQV